MQYTDNQYFSGNNYHINTTIMHNLKTNFDKFLKLTSDVLHEYLREDGNIQYYRNKPKMNDQEIIALSLCCEAMSIDSENFLWSKLHTDYQNDFPNLVHLTRFNARRKRLSFYTHRFNELLSARMQEGENVYLVDSIPMPVCKIAREKRLKVCRQKFETAPDKGYSAVNAQYYIGYKLHLVTTLKGIFHSMDLSKASMHDLHYLNDVKHSGLNNCLLLADKGYLSSEKQIDLFTSVGVELKTPMRSNQKDFTRYPHVFSKSRKRIETLFSQLCDQMMLKRNYAKTFVGLSSRVISKVAAVTALQYINLKNGRNLNHIKHALAA
ncbi:MAG: IS982 family transposase [Peptococcaceae bacterium]|nr:IS982 family transposase [Peptococcaceae bacterium]